VELSAGLVVADRFRLVRLLGQGGMGAVWLAQHTGLDVPCAVKFIHEQAARSPEIRARFEREAKAAAQLRSPHVVQILDHGVWEGTPYIAMEFLEGEDLGQRLQRCGRLPPPETLAVTTQIGRALSKAHAAGLIHRDLKPSNVFMVRDDDREIAKVLDFGVAKMKETGLDGSTRTGAILGTPFYMSPEQARGSKSIDHRADLWALAVLVYQCLLGKLPFMGEALGDLFVKIIVEPPPVPSQHGAVPAGFDAWWARATARDPNQRFQNAKELADTLGLALGVTVQAGVEVGSSLASSSVSAAPSMPSQGGTIALTPSQPGSAFPGAAFTPQPGAPYTPQPGGPFTPQPGPPLGTPFPGSAAPVVAPTPVQQAISFAAAPPPRRGGLVAAVIAGVLVLGGLAAFFALRGGSAAPASGAAEGPPHGSAAPAVTSAAPPPAPASAAPAPVESAAPTASATAATKASASPTTHAPAAMGATAPSTAVTAKPAGKSKTDFGF
jgi:serine/threonine protein kinase